MRLAISHTKVSASIMLLLSLLSPAAQCENDTLSFGINPIFSPKMGRHILKPSQESFTSVLKKQVIVRMPETYCQFLQTAKDNVYDIISVPPQWSGYLIEEFGFKPLVVSSNVNKLILFSKHGDEEKLRTFLRQSSKPIITGPSQLSTAYYSFREFMESNHLEQVLNSDNVYTEFNSGEKSLLTLFSATKPDLVVAPFSAATLFTKEIPPGYSKIIIKASSPYALLLANPKISDQKHKLYVRQLLELNNKEFDYSRDYLGVESVLPLSREAAIKLSLKPGQLNLDQC